MGGEGKGGKGVMECVSCHREGQLVDRVTLSNLPSRSQYEGRGRVDSCGCCWGEGAMGGGNVWRGEK